MITTMLRGVARVSQHEEAPTPPLSRRGLFSLCDALERLGPDALVLRAAVLFGVASLLRQSNFLAASSVSRLSHLITRGDLRVSEKEVLVYVRSSKTLRPESGGCRFQGLYLCRCHADHPPIFPRQMDPLLLYKPLRPLYCINFTSPILIIINF